MSRKLIIQAYIQACQTKQDKVSIFEDLPEKNKDGLSIMFIDSFTGDEIHQIICEYLRAKKKDTIKLTENGIEVL